MNTEKLKDDIKRIVGCGVFPAHEPETRIIERILALFPACEKCEGERDELIQTLTTLLAAFKGVIKQIPVDESLADWRLDFAEAAQEEAETLLNILNPQQ